MANVDVSASAEVLEMLGDTWKPIERKRFLWKVIGESINLPLLAFALLINDWNGFNDNIWLARRPSPEFKVAWVYALSNLCL